MRVGNEDLLYKAARNCSRRKRCTTNDSLSTVRSIISRATKQCIHQDTRRLSQDHLLHEYRGNESDCRQHRLRYRLRFRQVKVVFCGDRNGIARRHTHLQSPGCAAFGQSWSNARRQVSPALYGGILQPTNAVRNSARNPPSQSYQ